MTQQFADKVALVTGGASGIGRVTALALAKEGARVTVADVSVEAGEATAKMISDSGGQAIFTKTDVTKSGEVEAMVSETVKKFGRLDFALNNAGIDGVRARTADYPEEVWRQVIDIDLTGVFLCLKYELPVMAKQKGGVIVNLSSVAGVTGFPGHAAYTAAKHGVIGLTKTAAIDYAKVGIRVNAVCPAYTRTPMITRMLESHPEFEAKLIDRVPLKRLGTAEEIAQAVIYLFSDAAAFITGHSLVMDGGIVAE
ncbi:MAG: glucose 1-dehydrogenase [Verrucomicrobia bacterium]|nr:glucose 1-dehydrogenase [Verrucomicrobiota bacterium]